MAIGTAAQVDRRWAVTTALTGTVGVLSYIALSALTVPPPLQVALAFAFAFGLTVSSVGLYHLLMGRTPRMALVAALANTVAAAILLAMLLIQMAVKASEPNPSTTTTAIWLGLDVAWDLYIGAGTLLFALCMLRDPAFRVWLGVPGLLGGGALLALNVATFPIPPGEAGLVDVGPYVGLWYLAVSIRSGFLRK